jgi:hypothetical protein
MKAKSLLAQAARCKTNADAAKLLETLQRVFGNAKQIAHLPIRNEDYSMEGDKPFVRFEMHREISDHYVSEIRPEIRDGELVVCVVTNHMKDGHGLSSQNWHVVDGFDEEVITADPDQTVAQLAKRASEFAIADHRRLIERVGVPHDLAVVTAEKSW